MTQTASALQSNRVPDQVTEPELIARVLAGDRVAGRVLYDAHAPRVFRLAHRLVGDEELARELTQETFIRAFRQLATFRGDAALSTWLHRITLSVASNAMRTVRRRRARETSLEEAIPLEASARDGGGGGLDPDVRERLARAIDALPEIYRVTVIMHDLEGYTHTEIAAVLGVAEGTCKSRLFTARAQLRAALADFATELDT